jgi:hypothetical protein
MARQLTSEGVDTYIQLDQDDAVEIGDFRSAPLSQEFERMKADDLQLLQQGGIAIQDVGYPASQTATTTAALERNKTRLANHIVKVNASEAKFLRRIILDYIKRHISKKNDVPVATNTKVKLLERTPEIEAEVQKMVQEGRSEQEIRQFVMENAREGMQEAEMPTVTMGMVKEYLKDNKVYIQEDYSAWENYAYKLALQQTALGFAQGTPKQAQIQKEILATLGFDALSQDLAPQQGMAGPNVQQNLTPNPNVQATPEGEQFAQEAPTLLG